MNKINKYIKTLDEKNWFIKANELIRYFDCNNNSNKVVMLFSVCTAEEKWKSLVAPKTNGKRFFKGRKENGCAYTDVLLNHR